MVPLFLFKLDQCSGRERPFLCKLGIATFSEEKGTAERLMGKKEDRIPKIPERKLRGGGRLERRSIANEWVIYVESGPSMYGRFMTYYILKRRKGASCRCQQEGKERANHDDSIGEWQEVRR